MMSTGALELTRFVNPDLSWKTVTKGIRSTRRIKRPYWNLTAVLDLDCHNGKTMDDKTVSESEKLGVAVLGRRFSDVIENMPLKKRRTMFQSPSPPLKTSKLLVEASERQCGDPSSNGKQPLVANDVNWEIPQVANEKFDYFDDFSGIEMLAAAVCDNSLGDDVSHARPGQSTVVDLKTSGVPSENTDIALDKSNPVPEVVGQEDKIAVAGHEDKIADSTVRDNAIAISEVSTHDKDESTVDRCSSSRDVRLHWDLNTTMDTWEQPNDFDTVSSEHIVPNDSSADKTENLTACGKLVGESHDNKLDSQLVVSIANGDSPLVPSVLEEMSIGPCGVGIEEHKVEEYSGLQAEEKKLEEHSGLQTEEMKLEACSGLETEENKFEAGFGLETSEVKIKIESCSVLWSEENNLKRYSSTNTNCNHSASILTDITLGPSKTEISVEDCKGSQISVTENENSDLVSGGKLERFCGLEGVPVKESDISLRHEPVVERVAGHIEKTVVNEDGESFGRCSAVEITNADSSRPSEPILLEAEPVCDVKEATLHHSSPKSESATSAVEGQHSISVLGDECADIAVAAHLTQFVSLSHVSGVPTNSSGKGNKEDPSDGSCHSGVSQEEKSHVGTETSMDLPADCDSQIEDGELREPYQCWDDNEEENVDAEYVDYESECEEERFSGLETEVDQRKMKVERVITPGSENGSLKMRNVEVTDVCKVQKLPNDRMDGPNFKDFSSRMVGLKSSADRNRSDFGDDYYPRSERQRDGPSAYMRGMGEYHSNNGPYRRFRPKGLLENRGYLMASDHGISEEYGVAGLERRIRTRQYLGSSSNGLQRPFMRRRSPPNKRDVYCVQPVRDISPDRPKFKRYPPGINRSIRDEYHRSMPDETAEYPNRMGHRLVRRERSISPMSGGRYYYAQHYKKSRSRSRSRSPVSCLLPRERNEGSRHRSRSPRMERVRLPFQKRYVADCDDDMACAPRNRFSPPRNYRWFDDRSSGLDNNFRARKSPGSVFRPGQRFDSIQRVNSDDYVRRCPDMPNGAGRGGYKCESSDDDRRKFGNRYEMVQRVRRFETDGAVRRFPQRFDSGQRMDLDDYVRPMMPARRFQDMPGGTGRGGYKHEGGDDDRRKFSNRYDMIQRVRRYDPDGGARRFQYNAEDSFNCEEDRRKAVAVNDS